MKKFIKQAIIFSIPFAICFCLTGCAAGSATAGYSLKSMTADSLTATAEQRIIDRAKNEIYYELSAANQYNCNQYR